MRYQKIGKEIMLNDRCGCLGSFKRVTFYGKAVCLFQNRDCFFRQFKPPLKGIQDSILCFLSFLSLISPNASFNSQTLTLSLSLSLSHTHIHTHTLSLSLSLSLSVSPRYSRTHQQPSPISMSLSLWHGHCTSQSYSV